MKPSPQKRSTSFAMPKHRMRKVCSMLVAIFERPLSRKILITRLCWIQAMMSHK